MFPTELERTVTGVVLIGVILTLLTFAGCAAFVAALFRHQVRRYDAVTSRDVLDEWRARLELMEPEQRAAAAAAPPAAVLAAQLGLPSAGRRALRTGWGASPRRAG